MTLITVVYFLYSLFGGAFLFSILGALLLILVKPKSLTTYILTTSIFFGIFFISNMVAAVTADGSLMSVAITGFAWIITLIGMYGRFERQWEKKE